MASSSSSSSKPLDVEKKMSLKLKEKVEETPFKSVTWSAASITSKDVMKMKSLKIEETEEEGESVPISDTDHQSGGSSFVFGVSEEGSSSSNVKKKKRKKKKGKKTGETTEKGKEKYDSTTSSRTSMVLLRSGEGDIFEVEESIVLSSQTIKHMIEDSCVSENFVIPLNSISSDTLEKVLVFFEKHGHDEEKNRDEKEKQELIKWDEIFVKDLNQKTLFEMILAADYLDAKCLMGVTCQAAADMTIGMSPEQVRKFFNIKNDFTPEEEAEVRRENAWAFD